jgi:flagellar motor component MotA
MQAKNILGAFVLFGSIYAAIRLSGGYASMFIDLPSAILVILGTIGSTALGTSPGQPWNRVFLRAADASWKMGVLGVAIGLIGLLANLADPQTIGPHAAVALLSLFYGFGLSLLFKGLADAGTQEGEPLQ